jgi:ABC-2 type transport system permease protein
MEKIRTIISKEWSEVFKNRLVLFSVGFMPLLFVALPVITFLFTGDLGDANMTGNGGESLPGAGALCAGVSEAECAQLYMLNIYAVMFMILPVAIPVNIAAYSVAGEKATRSLEPLLATPITTTELLAGKALAAIIPAIVATWLSFAIFILAMTLMIGGVASRFLLDPLWLFAIVVVSPLLTLLSVSVAVMISSRVTDPRVAEQLSMLVILPVVLLLIGQSVGLILVDRTTVLLFGAVVLILDLLLGYFTLKAFQRETILTKWK